MLISHIVAAGRSRLKTMSVRYFVNERHIFLKRESKELESKTGSEGLVGRRRDK